MLTRFAMSNYRGFQSYQMEGLTQVNLLVGMNNSGKTAILEGIQFLESGGDGIVLDDIARRRGEQIVHPSTDTEPLFLSDVSHLYYGHVLDLGCSFELTADGKYKKLEAKIRKLTPEDAIASVDPRDSVLVRTRRGIGLAVSLMADVKTPELKSVFLFYRDTTGLQTYNRRRRYFRAANLENPVLLIGSDSLDATSLARLWDEITRLRREKEIVSAMQIIDPKVESVQFLTGMMAGGYYPSRGGIVVGRVGEEARQPLGSMGEGIWRLMALAMTLTHTRNGCLLIDEIDTGLHYSVMTEMWELVVKHAIESNVQVFATTHSWDCIEGLAGFCQQDPELREKVSIHKIDRKIPHSIPFGGDSIVRLVKADIDPR